MRLVSLLALEDQEHQQSVRQQVTGVIHLLTTLQQQEGAPEDLVQLRGLVDQEAVLLMAFPPPATVLLGKETTGEDPALTPIMAPAAVAELALLDLPQQMVVVGVLEKFLVSTELQHTMRGVAPPVGKVLKQVVDLAVVVMEVLGQLLPLTARMVWAAAVELVMVSLLAMPLQAQAVTAS